MKVITSKLLLLFVGILVLNCSNSYVDNIDRNEGYQFIPGYPEVRLVTAGIIDEYTDSTRITVIGEIIYASLIFKKVDDQFEAEITIDVQIIDNINPANIIDLKTYPITVTEKDARTTNSQKEYLFSKVYDLEPGDYTINFTVTDVNTNKQTVRTSKAYIPNPVDPISHITNIQIFSKDESLTNQFDPVTTYDISNQIDSVRFVFQVTNNNPDEPITIDSRLLKFRSDTTIARPMSFTNYNSSHIVYKGIQYDKFETITSSRRIINQPGSVSIEFIFPNLPRGNYRFEVRSAGEREEPLFKARDFSVKSLNYPSLKTPRELAAPLAYLMDKKEYNRLMAIENDVDLKKALDRFWLKNIKNSKKAQDVISLYYERVEQANKQFASYKEGWKTDMGMIYILFGPPWYVTPTLDQISWAYSYNLDEFGRNFFFRSPRVKNSEYPFYNYLLLRTPQYHQVEYRQRELWLNGLILKDNL
ncbi:MAG: GWxTD domain-containing protein [Balneola sp.]|nr:MAG: GWxTD domain-containing protein [Balneola sp.]